MNFWFPLTCQMSSWEVAFHMNYDFFVIFGALFAMYKKIMNFIVKLSQCYLTQWHNVFSLSPIVVVNCWSTKRWPLCSMVLYMHTIPRCEERVSAKTGFLCIILLWFIIFQSLLRSCVLMEIVLNIHAQTFNEKNEHRCHSVRLISKSVFIFKPDST